MEASMAMSDTNTTFLEKYVPDKPPLTSTELVSRAVLWLRLDDIALTYPSPSMPNNLAVADLMARPAKPLPKNLQMFLDNAKGGVVLVSFGSYVNLPEDIVQKLCQAFEKVPFTFLWKVNNPNLCKGSKVKTMKWLPQNDILAHPNVRVLITHGGFNSIIEAIYHAKPMIAFPIAFDQPFNTGFVRYRDLGISMDIGNFTFDELYGNIMKVLKDQTISHNIKRASLILRNKPHSTGKRVSFWLNHVIKYGDKHLRSAAYQMTIFEFLMVDVFLFLVFITCVSITLLITICYCFYKLLTKISKIVLHK